MTPELDRQLCDAYPKIFIDRHGDPQKTLMCFGFECEDGWFRIIEDLCYTLQHHADVRGTTQAVAVQVKEKFGTLRFYADGLDDYGNGAVAYAELLSGRTCETCGAGGIYRSGRWIRTLCDPCAERKP